MFDVIFAMTKEGGIGFEGDLPWKCREELMLFKKITMGCILIVGRKTAESLPPLKDRTVVVLSSNTNASEVHHVCTSIHEVLRVYSHSNRKIFITGGTQVYNEVFSCWRNHINRIYLSVMNDNYKCDTFINFDPMEWTLDKKFTYDHNKFVHYELLPIVPDESKYLRLLSDVNMNGWTKKGRNGNTKSMFGKTLEFDLTKGYPLLTTKKMFFRGIVEELLFFIRGDTDTKLLSDKNIKIWNGNTSREFLDSIGKNNRREGVMGPMYGAQWRYFNAEYDEKKPGPKGPGLDQLKNVINQIRTDQNSRRILLTDYNPLQATEGVLFPCHSIIIQFYVQEGYLDMFCFNRSQDLFLGTPFNIASSALLLTLISHITNLTPRKMILSLGDCHIYEEHSNAVQENLTRVPFKFPTLEIKKELKELEDIEKMEYNDIRLVDYNSYPTIKAKMIS